MRVDIAADGELVITKTNKDGVAMLIVDEDAAITYSFISKKVGQYDSLHRTDDVQLVELVEKFNAVADESPIKEDGEDELRPCVKWFAQQMEKVLRQNDHKGGWDMMGKAELMDNLEDEVSELKYEHSSNEKIIKEAVDVANFAMMIADLQRKTPNQ